MSQDQVQMTPTRIEKHSDKEFLIAWSQIEAYTVPFFEVRFLCPCAECVDEKTGKRVIQRDKIPAGIKPLSVKLIGRYALQINWSDAHSTGMYSYDQLWKICQSQGTLTRI